MILSREHLRRIVRTGEGREDGIVRHENVEHVIVTRLDLARVDHFVATDADVQRLSGNCGEDEPVRQVIARRFEERDE